MAGRLGDKIWGSGEKFEEREKMGPWILDFMSNTILIMSFPFPYTYTGSSFPDK